MPLVVRLGRREPGQARSQDIGLVVLVVALGARTRAEASFSVKEKDEASPIPLFGTGTLNHVKTWQAFIHRFAGV